MTDTVNAESTGLSPRRQSTPWLRIMSWLYDPFLGLGELFGMRSRRKALLRSAHGRVVELGAGTGLNLRHYPDDVTELVLTEPEPGMRARLSRRVKRQHRTARIVDAGAELLPLPDSSVDTVVSTLVLCTVTDPEAALRELERVLRPDGQLLFIEHVRSGSRLLAACQDWMVEPWRHFAGGCICNRRTLDLMRAAGFTVAIEDDSWHGMPAIVHPLIVGSATRSHRVDCEHRCSTEE